MPEVCLAAERLERRGGGRREWLLVRLCRLLADALWLTVGEGREAGSQQQHAEEGHFVRLALGGHSRDE